MGPGAYPGPPIPPPRAKKPAWLLPVVIGCSVLSIACIAALVVVGQLGAGPSGPVKADQCIDVRFDMEKKQSSLQRVPVADRVACDDAEAKGKVVKIAGAAEGGFGGTAPDCPAGVDGVAHVRTAPDDRTYMEVCARNVKGPHPGDPGVGGAMITVGDCVSASMTIGTEAPCSGGSYAKVVARVNTMKECPSTTLETMELETFGGGAPPRPVLCLGGEGKIVAAGECIEDPSLAFGALETVPCDSKEAIAKVLDRVRTKRECPDGTTHNLKAKDDKALLPIMCVKKLRPTLTERLKSLGS